MSRGTNLIHKLVHKHMITKAKEYIIFSKVLWTNSACVNV